MKRAMSVSVTADDLIRRFDARGGRMHHFRGRRVCLVSTFPEGQFRVRHSRTGFGVWLLPESALIVREAEHVTKREYVRANRILRDRATRMPAVVPTLAMLESHLRAIRIDTIASSDEAWGEVNLWCRIVEVCETAESARAFSYDVMPDLKQILSRTWMSPADRTLCDLPTRGVQ